MGPKVSLKKSPPAPRGSRLRRRLLGPVAVEPRVGAVGLEQLLVGALLGDPAVVEHHDPARPADRREAVGDHYRRATGQQAP